MRYVRLAQFLLLVLIAGGMFAESTPASNPKVLSPYESKLITDGVRQGNSPEMVLAVAGGQGLSAEVDTAEQGRIPGESARREGADLEASCRTNAAT